MRTQNGGKSDRKRAKEKKKQKGVEECKDEFRVTLTLISGWNKTREKELSRSLYSVVACNVQL